MTSVPETAPQDAVLRYSNTAVALHWITVALVLLQAYLGLTLRCRSPVLHVTRSSSGTRPSAS